MVVVLDGALVLFFVGIGDAAIVEGLAKFGSSLIA